MLLNRTISIWYFAKLIWLDFVVITVYAIAAFAARHLLDLHSILIPLSMPMMIGTLISLLLGFRTSQSYERWWEARIIWGSIVNDSRTLIRQVKQFLPHDERARQHLKSFTERQVIWLYALGESLRRLPFSKRVQAYLDKYGIKGGNVPNLLLEGHSEELKQFSATYCLNANLQIQLDTTISRLTDSMGKCERIKNTVFPKAYTMLIMFIIYTFLTILPFGLEEVGDGGELILCVLLPMLFVMIERTALLMQDPFENRPTDTPVTALAQSIERSLNEMVGEPTKEPQLVSDSYYQL